MALPLLKRKRAFWAVHPAVNPLPWDGAQQTRAMKPYGIKKTVSGGQSGFTVVEIVIALFILGILSVAVISALSLAKVQTFKDAERGIISDFMVHYLEQVKGLPFAEVTKGSAINPLYNGTVGAPNVRIPNNFNWFSLNNTNYQLFHPELVWIEGRQPEMRVDLNVTQAGGADHTKVLRVELRWDAPLGQGNKSHARMEMVRVRDN